MFGGTKTPFGGGGFGSNTSAFGAQQSTPFGGTSSSGGLFGSTPAAGTFGTPSFGSTPASGGLFSGGTSSGTSLFGNKTTQSSGFGFGNTGTSTSGGLFGSSGSSLFQTPKTNNTFGQQKSAFGGFGTSSSGNAFGTNTSSAFGTASTGGGLFGTSGASGGTSLFGQQAQSGTTVKFQPVIGSEQSQKSGIHMTVKTQNQCITVMDAYKTKSIEELRLEDYAANRKGSGSSGFGTSTGSTGLFGSNSNSTTGTSLFGNQVTSKPSGFGGFGSTSTSGGLFGQTNTSLFGAKTTSSLFGSTTTTTASSGFGGFGQTTGGGMFGNTNSSGFGFGSNTTSQPSLFGGTASGFGATTSSSGGLFGGTSTFGQTSTQSGGGGLFGSAAKPTFGFGTASSGTALGGTNTFSFGAGNTSSSGGLFGATQNKPAFSFGGGSTGFGGNTSGFGGFGAATSSSGGLFGNTSSSGGLFGSKPLGFGTNTNTSGTSLFGGNTGLSFGGSTANTLGASTLGGFGNIDQGTLAAIKQQQMIQQQLKAIANTPFGDSPLFRNLPSQTKAKTTQHNAPIPSREGIDTSQYKVLSRPTARIKPKAISSPSLGKSRLFEGLEDEGDFSPHPINRKQSVKKLIIKDKSHQDLDSPYESQLKFRSLVNDDTNLIAPSPQVVKTKETTSMDSPVRARIPSGPVFESTMAEFNPKDVTPIMKKTKDYILTPASQSMNDSLNATNDEDIPAPAVDPKSEEPKCKIVLRRPEYYTRPSISELDAKVNEGSCMVRDFTVGREGYGEVAFLGNTDVYGLDLDKIVFFRRREAEVYPDDYENKPEVGEELNKPSEITLNKVWPNDKTTHTPVKTPERLKSSGFIEKIEEKTMAMGAVFVDYRPKEGAWVFKVNHFTRYGIQEQYISDDIDPSSKSKDKSSEQSFFDDIDFQRDAIKRRLQQHIFQKYEGEEEEVEMNDESEEEVVEVIKQDDEEKMMDDDSENQIDSQNDQTQDDIYEENLEEEFIPLSHQLSHVARVQPFRVQGMKTSILYDDEDDDDYRPSPKTCQKGQQLFSNKSIFSSTYVDPNKGSPFPKMDTSKTVVDQNNTLNSSLFQPFVKDSPHERSAKMSKKTHLFKSSLIQKQMILSSDTEVVSPESENVVENVYVKCKSFQMVPYDKSLMYGKTHLLADVSLVHGREFNIRWSNDLTFTHTGKQVSFESSEPKKALEPHIFSSVNHQPLPSFGLCDLNVNIEKISMETNEGMKQFMEDCLEISLKYTNFENNGTSSLDLLAMERGIDALEEYVEVAQKFKQIASDDDFKDFKGHSDVWQLAAALWGKQDTDDDSNLYEIHSARRGALTKWLSDVCCDDIEQNVETQKLLDNGHLSVIFSLLSGHQITKACQVARENKEFRLGFLLAQASGDQHIKHYLRNQLSQWEENNVDEFMNKERLKLYVLLSGMMVWKSNKHLINLCDNLDWKRCLALHLWYYCPSTATILDAFTEYQSSFKGTDAYGKYAAFPSPEYLRHGDNDNNTKDLCYHLLALYCNRPHSLENMLTPQTHTSAILDYHLSWHLQRVLQEIGYTHISDERHSFLQYSYASQLESSGLWYWAVYVLMHLRDEERREYRVREILRRYCRVNEDDSIELSEHENMITDKFHVPAEWIHEAKALHAKYTKKHYKEAMHLVRASQWNRAHQVIVEKLAADAIIEDDHSMLCDLLHDIALPERLCTVKNWKIGGQVFLDYISLYQKLEDIKSGAVALSLYHLEDMETEVASLINRISLLKVNTSRERLCQSEMARNCSNMLKVVFSEMKSRENEQEMDEDNPKWSTVKVAPYVVKLPLPPDYYLKELRELLANYANELEEDNLDDEDS